MHVFCPMRKSAIVFLLAVLLPSAVLGWLALRNAEEQKIIYERRTAELYQKEVDNLAEAARAVVDGQRRAFAGVVRKLIAGERADEVADHFATRLADVWPRKAVGFALDADGRLVSPSPRAAEKRPDWQKFLFDQGAFLGGRITASVYTVPVDELVLPDVTRKLRSQRQVPEAPREALALEVRKSMPAPANGAAPGADQKLRMRLEFPPAKKELAPTAEAKDEPERTAAVTKADAPEPSAPPADELAPDAAQREVPPPAPAGSRAMAATTPIFDVASRPPAEDSALAERRRALKSQVRPAAPSENFRRAARAQKQADQAAAPAPTAPIAAEPGTIADGIPPVTQPAQPPPSSATAELIRPEPAEEDLAKLQREAVALAEREATRRQEVQALQLRNVRPQKTRVIPEQPAWSTLLPENVEFRTLCAGRDEGIITRFVQDRLSLIFWLRPSQAPELIFGCLVDVADLADLWPAAMPDLNADRSDYVLALLDDRAHPAAVSPPNETRRDWKRPFVASEIGEALPHWEAALYLMRPEQLQESARGVRRTLTLLIAGMVGAIALGGWMVVADTRRQLVLAQQKTDFVSNVSHELKTPLTSIRMFAELILSGRGETSAKTPQYVRIIMVEAERLTRLINNVLDFAKLERRQKRFDKKPIDLHEVIERMWEGQELHLRDSGFATRWEAAAPPYPVIGDDDALAQILVNLLSNAEKYSTGERKEIELHSYLDGNAVCVSVLDRGTGVPDGEEGKIFEAFYRAHDSLSSGIQGSGLGLTLARRLAREHGGDITHSRRKDGGSNFTLRLPLSPNSDSSPA